MERLLLVQRIERSICCSALHLGATHSTLRVPRLLGVGALRDRVAALRALRGLDRVERELNLALGLVKVVELAEGQAKRAGDSDVSPSACITSEPIRAFGSGSAPWFTLTAAENN